MNGELPVIYLARHGETAWSLSGQHTGLTDLPLTERGERTARRLGERLRELRFVKVLTSPLERARRTCELAGFGRAAELDPDLVEWDYGDYEGLRTAEIRAQRPGWQLFRDGCPGGESPAGVGARADRVVARVRAIDDNVLLFSSGHFIRVLASRWLGLEPSANARHFMLSTASLSALGYENELSRPVIRLWNETRHVERDQAAGAGRGGEPVMNVLVCNAGSSTLKFALLEAEGERVLAKGTVEWPAAESGAVGGVFDELRAGHRIDAVGHRVVHGGERFTTAVLVTAEVERTIGELAELAPLHNQPSLAVIRAVARLLPGVPQVAAFDTAFHATIPEAARTYPLPRQWTRDWRLRRYGFHGLSHSYCAARAAEMLGRADRRLVIAHLGNGASVSAVRNGACVDTTMGFTPLEGLMMGTRSGSVDPGLLIYLLREKGLDAERLDTALNHESGLLGVSGVSSDMREVLAAAPRDPDAKLAVDIYVHRVRGAIGAMAATLGGVDGLVFTAGVGENSPEIRGRVCAGLEHLGLALDRGADGASRPDADVSAPGAAGRVLVIATREDLSIVREVRRLVRPAAAARRPQRAIQ